MVYNSVVRFSDQAVLSVYFDMDNGLYGILEITDNEGVTTPYLVGIIEDDDLG